MDVFSMGCVIAELFLDGVPLFDLAGLISYRKGEDLRTLHSRLAKIGDSGVVSLISSMIQLDPWERLSASEYLFRWEGSLFPKYFRESLHPFLASILALDSEAKLIMADHEFETIVRHICSEPDNPVGEPSLRASTASLPSPNSAMGEAGEQSPGGGGESTGSGLSVIVSLVTSSLRNVRHASSKLIGLKLLVLSAEVLDDGIRMQRILPYTMALLEDHSPMVRTMAIHCMTTVLGMVQSLEPTDTNVFGEYILPKLEECVDREQSDCVRVMIGRKLAELTRIAKLFLNVAHLSQLHAAQRQTGTQRKNQGGLGSYDSFLAKLREGFNKLVNILLTPPSPSAARRQILNDISQLCLFFGQEMTKTHVLPIVITFLNDPDIELRAAFFANIVPLGRFVGKESVHLYIRPCMLHGLIDDQDHIVECALSALARLGDLGLLCKSDMLEMAKESAALLCHPSSCIRFAAVALFCSLGSQMDSADLYCFVIPAIQAFLRVDIVDLTEESLMESLLEPLPRPKYDKLVTGILDVISNTPEQEEWEGKVIALADELSVGASPEEKAMLAGMLGHTRRRVFEGYCKAQYDQVSSPEPSPVGSGAAGEAHDSSTVGAASPRPVVKPWRPEGILVAHLDDHKGPVRHLAASDDSTFFASGSDDGTVKVWCMEHLEEDYVNSVDLQAPITAMAICEQTHNIAAAANDGTICVFNVDYTRRQASHAVMTSGVHQGRCVAAVKTVRELQVEDGYALSMRHFNAAAESLLVYSTSSGGIHGWDLRAPREAWAVHSRVSDGLPQALCLAENRLWMCAGSSRGFFNCWDLRFQVLAHSWRHPACVGITRLVNHPAPNQSGAPWVVACTEKGSELSAWDVTTGMCRQLYRAFPHTANDFYPSTEPRKAGATPEGSDYGLADLAANIPSAACAIQALCAPAGTAGLLSAGTDRKIRLWNTMAPRESYTVTGGTADTAYDTLKWDDSGIAAFDGTMITQEVCMDANAMQHRSQQEPGGKVATPGLELPSPHHKDAILDMLAADMHHQKVPTRAIVTASRDGTVKVFK